MKVCSFLCILLVDYQSQLYVDICYKINLEFSRNSTKIFLKFIITLRQSIFDKLVRKKNFGLLLNYSNFKTFRVERDFGTVRWIY